MAGGVTAVLAANLTALISTFSPAGAPCRWCALRRCCRSGFERISDASSFNGHSGITTPCSTDKATLSVPQTLWCGHISVDLAMSGCPSAVVQAQQRSRQALHVTAEVPGSENYMCYVINCRAGGLAAP